MPGCANRVQLHVQHPLGDDASFARPRDARVLNGVLQIEQHPRAQSRVAIVHQHGPAAQQIAVALEREIDRRIEQRMPGADEGGRQLALWCDERLLEDDALVTG
jgi:hypothetical protein